MPIEIRFPPPAHLANPISRVWLAESIFTFERIKHLPYGESDKCDNDRLAAVLRPFKTETLRAHPGSKNRSSTNGKRRTGATPADLLPVKDTGSDKIRLLSRREIVAVFRKGRHTWIHTVREELSTRYPLTLLAQWLGGRPFIQIGRHAIVNEQAIELITQHGDRLYRVQLPDRLGTEITASREGAAGLAVLLKSGRLAHATVIYRTASRVVKPI
jgi:DNA-binding LytR/AlgR family response regulator